VDADVVAGRGRQVLADEIGADRKLAMSAVNEYGEPDRARTPVVDERIHRRTDRAAGEEHVVDEDDHAPIHRKRDLRLTHDRCVADPCQIVAVQGDVDRAERDVDAFVRSDRRLDARRERVPARANADDGENGEVAVTLDDLVRDPRDSSADIVRGKQRGRLALLPGLTGPVVKGGGAVFEYRFDDTALRRAGTIPAVP
jgi:hypothetical protein